MSVPGSSRHLSRSGDAGGALDTSNPTSSSQNKGTSNTGRGASASHHSTPYANGAFGREDSRHQRPLQQRGEEEGGEGYSDAPSQTVFADYPENEVAQARAVLAAAGYPSPSSADLLNVLNQARLLQSAEVDTSIGATTSSNAAQQSQQQQGSFSNNQHASNDGVWEQTEEVPVDAAAPPIPSPPVVAQDGEGATPHPQPAARQAVQRPPWDSSTRLSRGAPKTADQEQPHRPRPASGRRQTGRLPLTLQACATASRVPADSPAALLQPSARLERYVRYYERALRDSYRRHPDLLISSQETQNVSRDGVQNNVSGTHTRRPGDGSLHPFPTRQTGAVMADGQPARVLAMPLEKAESSARHRDPTSANAAGPALGASRETGAGASPRSFTSPAQRRAANVIYAKTSDPRYRFNLLDDVIASGASSSPSGSRAGGSPGPGLPSSSARLRKLEQQPQVFPVKYNPSAVDRQQGHVLSTYAVRYLSADGSTLPRKADPVARGQQMRALWSRDSFLENQAKRASPSETKAPPTRR